MVKEKGVYEIGERDWTWINAVHDAGINIIAIFNYGTKIYPIQKMSIAVNQSASSPTDEVLFSEFMPLK